MSKLKELRKSKKMTQRELAYLLGVKRTTVTMWETNRAKPRADKLPALAKLFGCTIEELLQSKE